MLTRRIFHRVVKNTIDRTKHTWVYVDYFDFDFDFLIIWYFDNRCPFKKKLKDVTVGPSNI